jgi:hypothetical protein
MNGEKLKTPIVCPPGIYGPGRSLGRTQSVYILWKDKVCQKTGYVTGEETATREG